MFYIEKTFLPHPKPGRSESGYQVRDGVVERRVENRQTNRKKPTTPAPVPFPTASLQPKVDPSGAGEKILH